MSWENSIVAVATFFCGKHFHKFSRLLPVHSNNSLSLATLKSYRHVEIRCNFKYFWALRKGENCVLETHNNQASSREHEEVLWDMKLVERIYCSYTLEPVESTLERVDKKKSFSSSFTLFSSLMQHNPPECRLPSTFHSCFSCIIPMEALFFLKLTLVSLWKFSRCSDTHTTHWKKKENVLMWNMRLGRRKQAIQCTASKYEWKECREQLMKSIVRVFQLFFSSGFWFFNGGNFRLSPLKFKGCVTWVSAAYTCVS